MSSDPRATPIPRRRSPRHWIVIALGVVFATLVGALAWNEWSAARAELSAASLRTQISAALPPGSSEAAVYEFLDKHGFAHEKTVLAHPGTDSDGNGLPAGFPLIAAHLYQSGGLIFAPERTLFVTFVMDDRLKLDHFFVSERDQGPS